MRFLHWSIPFLIIFLYSFLTGCVTMSTFEAKEKEAAQAWNELATARDASRKLNADLETTREERASLERQLEEMRSSLKLYHGRTAELERQLEEMRSSLKLSHGWTAELERQLEEMRSSLKVAYGRTAELEQTLSSQRSEIIRLSQISASKEEQLSLLKTTHDRLVSDLKREIDAGEIKISQYKDLLTVNLVEKILFESGKTEIKPRGLEVLKRVGEILNDISNKQIRIEGHTDNVPIGPVLAAKYPTNWELSSARATVVARFFQEEVEIPPVKLAPIGYGEYRPVTSNDSLEGRAQNRRIEIILAPLPPNREVN